VKTSDNITDGMMHR